MLLGLLAAAVGGLIVGSASNLVAGRLAAGGSPLTPPRWFAWLSGLLFAAVVIAHHDDGSELVLGLALVALLVVLALIDLDRRRLPGRIIAAAAVTAVVLGTLVDAPGELERLLAAAATAGLVLLVALAHPRGPGIADVQLAAVLGLFLGREAGAAVLIALACAAVVGIVNRRRADGEEGRDTRPPFGVFLALGGIGAVLFGDALVSAYLAGF